MDAATGHPEVKLDRKNRGMMWHVGGYQNIAHPESATFPSFSLEKFWYHMVIDFFAELCSV